MSRAQAPIGGIYMHFRASSHGTSIATHLAMTLIRKHIATFTSSTLLVASLASVTLTAAGCERKKTPAEKVEDAVDDVGDEIEEATDD